MNKELVINASHLSYHYSNDVQTLLDISLKVEKGCIYGFLGPNGSGKTTTLSLILGLLKKQHGSIEIFGQQLESNRVAILKKIGSVIESPSLYGHLSARENLEIYRIIYDVPKTRVDEVLKLAELTHTRKKPVKKFSLGMRQRLAIALALLPSPELLILDEPSNGLDPNGIIELRRLIKDLNEKHGMTILISSHLLHEVEKMVSHVGIIYKGKMLFQGPLPELHLFQQKGSRILIKTSDNKKAVDILKDHDPLIDGDEFTIAFQDQKQVAAVQKQLIQNDLEVYLLQPKGNDLEQLFIDLTSAES